MTFYYKSEAELTQVQPPEGGGGVPPTEPPLVIWGPGDPRPTLPIAGWDPGSGTWPDRPPPVEPPLTIWGPNDPRPTVPIAEPPWGWGNPPPKPAVPPASGWKVMYGWTPTTGWFVFAVPTGPVPTPSKK
jgi:hypothetical protein